MATPDLKSRIPFDSANVAFPAADPNELLPDNLRAVTAPTKPRILLADDHEVVRRGLRAILGARLDWNICGEASNGREAVERARVLKPDLVVMDIAMPELNGLGAARIILRELPRT